MIIWKDAIGARVVPFCKWAPINLTLSLGEIAVWKIFNCSQCNDTKLKWPKQETDKGRNKQRNILLVWDELGWDAPSKSQLPAMIAKGPNLVHLDKDKARESALTCASGRAFQMLRRCKLCSAKHSDVAAMHIV